MKAYNTSTWELIRELNTGYPNLSKIKALVENDANYNAKDVDGFTMLMFAAMKDYAPVVRYFLSLEGININALGPEHNTALHLANSSTEVINMLLGYEGMDANIQNSYGDTALHVALARENTDKAKLILDSGKVDFEVVNKAGETVCDIVINKDSLRLLELLDYCKDLQESEGLVNTTMPDIDNTEVLV